jgi:hypothetical protein
MRDRLFFWGLSPSALILGKRGTVIQARKGLSPFSRIILVSLKYRKLDVFVF